MKINRISRSENLPIARIYSVASSNRPAASYSNSFRIEGYLDLLLHLNLLIYFNQIRHFDTVLLDIGGGGGHMKSILLYLLLESGSPTQ